MCTRDAVGGSAESNPIYEINLLTMLKIILNSMESLTMVMMLNVSLLGKP